MSIKNVKRGTLEYLTAEGISAVHCFTTRHGGISTGRRSSMNIAYGNGDSMENVEKNLHILANAFGFTSISFVEYVIAVAIGALVIPIVEIVKAIQRKAEN